MVISQKENYPNWCEYQDLFDEWPYEDLVLAKNAIYDHQLADSLYESESPIIAFLVDTVLQEKLLLFFEDRDNYREVLDW